jgi:hypothetical protein
MPARDFSTDLESYEAEVIVPDSKRDPAKARRDFAAGYLAALRNDAPRQQLIAQVLDTARQFGRAVERAR